MNKIVLPENHFSLTSTTDITDICKPLFENSPIAYFCWFRMFNNGYSQLLISNPDLPKFHLNIKNYLVTPKIDEKLIKKQFYYFSFPDLNDKFDEALYNYKILFNIHCPIYLFEKFDNYYDSFWFASQENNLAIYNFYLNNMNMLEKFKSYFKDKAESLIQKTDNNRLIIPNTMQSNLSRAKLISTPPDRLINQHKPLLTLSKREMEVTQWLARGRTLKEIAKVLQLSPRTVEQYLNSVKRKTGLERKSQIIDLIMGF